MKDETLFSLSFSLTFFYFFLHQSIHPKQLHILMDYIVLSLLSCSFFLSILFLSFSSFLRLSHCHHCIQERDVRIIVGSFDGEWAGRIFCQVSNFFFLLLLSFHFLSSFLSFSFFHLFLFMIRCSRNSLPKKKESKSEDNIFVSQKKI